MATSSALLASFFEQYGQPAVAPKKVLLLGGTRFAGAYLARLLLKQGHDLTAVARGVTPVLKFPGETEAEFTAFKAAVKYLWFDRNDTRTLVSFLSGKEFDVVYDTSGVNAAQVKAVLDVLPNIKQYVYLSTVGVYFNKFQQLPYYEEDTDSYDPKVDSTGALETERLLQQRGVTYTILRVSHVLGPLNFDPIEQYFFHRIKAGRPICIPYRGNSIKQFGGVKDLAYALTKVLANPKAFNQIFNISGHRVVTINQFAAACAAAANLPLPRLVYYNPADFKPTVPFPLGENHVIMSVDKAEDELGWKPTTSLEDILRETFVSDFNIKPNSLPDFTRDDEILEKLKGEPAKPEPGVTSFTVPAEAATVVWLNTPEQYLTVVAAPGSNASSGNSVRLNKVMWLELTANAPVVGVRPGSYTARARIQLQPGWSTEELTLTATPANGTPASRTYSRAELAGLGNGWVELTAGPVVVTKLGHVSVKVHAFRTGDWKKGILFDEFKLGA